MILLLSQMLLSLLCTVIGVQCAGPGIYDLRESYAGVQAPAIVVEEGGEYIALPPTATPTDIEEAQGKLAYSQAIRNAIINRRPLIVGVGCNAPDGGDWGTVECHTLPNTPAPSLVIAIPDGQGWMTWAKTLPADATVADIEEVLAPSRALNRRGRVSSVAPFAQRDDKFRNKLVSLGIDIPNLRTYRSTRWTQRLVIQNDAPHTSWHPIGANDPVVNAVITDPNRKFPWAVPGGLHNDTDWESVLATNLDNDYLIFQNRLVSVPASGQRLPRQTWIYPNNAVFVDMLTYKGRPFVVRTLTKINNRWVPRTPFIDKMANPPFFHGAGKACMECHSKAGTNDQYGISIRGWDGIFSYNPLKDHRSE